MQETLFEKLRELIRGQVLSGEQIPRLYSRDQSIYEIVPQAVVLPEDVDDIKKLVLFAVREGIPITARGGGSGTAGSALGSGIVMVFPKTVYWSRISGFSASGSTAQVTTAAGVYHNDLQQFLKAKGFFLPADVTSADISRISGNIATRASGPHALRYGSIDRFLESVQFVTAAGEVADTADEASIPDRLMRDLARIEQRIRSDAVSRAFLESRKGLKTSSGYDLFSFLEDLSPGRRIARLLAGSVGTLGIITAARLRAESYSQDRAVILLYFDGLAEAGRAVSLLNGTDASAIEIISRETIRVMRSHAVLPDRFAVDAHLLFAETSGPDREKKIRHILTRMKDEGARMSAPPVVALSGDEIETIWTARKQILWMIGHPGPKIRALAVVNDVGVPVDRLAPFIADVQKVFSRHGIEALVYGHAGNGNLHLRPLFDTGLPDLPGRVRRLADDVYDAVLRHQGTITAEHGMGRLRAPYLSREWGDALYGYMREVKSAFDPRDILNPGVMFSDAAITDNMRRDLKER